MLGYTTNDKYLSVAVFFSCVGDSLQHNGKATTPLKKMGRRPAHSNLSAANLHHARLRHVVDADSHREGG
jgi:hypothetical protein